MINTIVTHYPIQMITKKTNSPKRITTTPPKIDSQLSFREKQKITYFKNFYEFVLEANEWHEYVQRAQQNIKATLTIYLNKKELTQMDELYALGHGGRLNPTTVQQVKNTFITSMIAVGITNVSSLYDIKVKKA